MSEIPLARTMRDGDRALSSDAPAWNRTVDHAGPPVEHLQVQTLDQDGEHFLMFIRSVFYFCPGRAGPGRARPKKAPKLTKTGVPKSGFFSAETRVAEMAGRAGSGRVGPGRAGSGRFDSIFPTHSQQLARASREPHLMFIYLPLSTLVYGHTQLVAVAHSYIIT